MRRYAHRKNRFYRNINCHAVFYPPRYNVFPKYPLIISSPISLQKNTVTEAGYFLRREPLSQ